MERKKHICILLIVCLLFSAVLMSTPSHAYSPEGEEPQRVEELTGLRERNSDTWLLSDGGYEAVIYAGNKYYPTENGIMEPIDASIVSKEYSEDGIQYSYANAANDWNVFFSNQGDVLLEDPNDKTLSFSLKGIHSDECILGGITLGDEIGLELQGDNCLAYSQVYENVDIVYKVTDNGVKEYIVLYSADVPVEYTFSVRADCEKLTITDNGELLYGEEDNGFLFGSLFIVDGKGDIHKTASYDLDDSENEVSITLDPSELLDSSTVFPLIIDPSITISGILMTKDSFVSKKNPDTNYNSGNEMNYLWTGRNSLYYTCRSYIKFTFPDSLTAQCRITAADIRIEKYAGSTPTVRALRAGGSWTHTGITWNNKPNGYPSGQSETMTNYSGNWYKADVTSIVSLWHRGAASNYGFIIKDDIESGTDHFTTFYSSDAPSPHKPELHITYYLPSHNGANLIGIPAAGHSHQNILYTVSDYLLGWRYSSSNVYVRHMFSFSVSNIRYYLSNDAFEVFLNRTHGEVVRDASGTKIGTAIVIKNEPKELFTSNSDMNSLDMSNMNLALFVCCQSAKGGENSTNLPSKAVANGANAAVGFTQDIGCYASNAWLEDMMLQFENGRTIRQACVYLKGTLGYNTDGLQSYVICGDDTVRID